MFRLIIASFFILGMLFVSCKEGTNTPKETENSMVTTEATKEFTETNTISIDSFNTWIARWDSTYRSYMNTNALNYFDMPIIDLKEVLGENVNGSRFYMGMEELSGGAYTPHLMLVGLRNGVVDSTNVFDYSTACPPKCN